MIVDLIEPGNDWNFRYETDCCPRVGETITQLQPERFVAKILSVDHLITLSLNGEFKENIITCEVKLIRAN